MTYEKTNNNEIIIQCDCEESSCKTGCTKKHTCKEFWCEKCKPERYTIEYLLDPNEEYIKNSKTIDGQELDAIMEDGTWLSKHYAKKIKESRKEAINDCVECVRELNHGSFLGEPILNKKTVLSKLSELE